MADDPYKYFRIEAAELVELMTRGLLAIENGTMSADGLPLLLRQAHTLKGAARVVRQLEIAEATHAIESTLAECRDSGVKPTTEAVNQMLGRLDSIQSLLRSLGTGAEAPAVSAPGSEPLGRTLRAELADVDILVDGLAEALVEVEQLGAAPGRLRSARLLLESAAHRLDLLVEGERRHPMERLRGELHDLNLALGPLEAGIEASVEVLRRELDELRLAAERLRLIPASTAFTFLERAVRDAAQELGKSVEFVTRGDEVRLDGHVLEPVQKALLHVVRNAVAHGIEMPAERRSVGKSPKGRVALSVERRQNVIVFHCEDDGRGVDVAALRRRLGGNGKSGLNDDEMLMTLLESGISTSAQITPISGRGVGLDVVGAAARQLGGSVQLRSRAGHGFHLELSVPLSLAGIAGLLVQVGAGIVAIPLDSIVEVKNFEPRDIAHSPEGDNLRHDNVLIPIFELRDLLELSSPSEGSLRSVVVARGRDGDVALLVERVLRTTSAVLRPLPRLVPTCAFISGAVLDPLGKPTLVLNPSGIEPRQRRHVAAAATEKDVPVVLVIDDSLTTRMLEQSILEAAGYAVDLAASAEEGLAKATLKNYAMFLVDVEMPGMSGFEFIKTIRAEPNLARTPAVLVSSRSAAADLALGETVGANGYIVKDRFDQKELIGLIRRFVEAQ